MLFQKQTLLSSCLVFRLDNSQRAKSWSAWRQLSHLLSPRKTSMLGLALSHSLVISFGLFHPLIKIFLFPGVRHSATGLPPSAAMSGEVWVPPRVLTEELMLFLDRHCCRGRGCGDLCSNWTRLPRGARTPQQRTRAAK